MQYKLSVGERPLEIIYPVPKSPHRLGRVGKREFQDWYQSVIAAKMLLEQSRSAQVHAKVLLLTATNIAGQKPEIEIYLDALKELGVEDDDTLVVRKGFETIGHLEAAMEVARKHKARLVVISTLLHSPRVRWLCRRNKEVHHRTVIGIPRPKEAVTDLVLSVLFPLIDICGGRAWFLGKVGARRTHGRL